MRYLPLATLLLLVSSVPASAQIGPPQPRADQHGYSLGVGVDNVESRWTFGDLDVARQRIYVEGSYAFTDSVEAFGRAGISDWVINDIATFRPGLTQDVSTDGSPPGFLSGGLRGKMWQVDRWSIGGSLEVGWYSGMDRFLRWNYNAYQELFFEPTLEITAALTVGCDLGKGVVYAGPRLHFGYSYLDVRTHTFGPDWDVEDSVRALTIRDKGGYGGSLGWRTPIGEKGWHLQLEGAALRGGFAGQLGFYRAW